MARILLQQVTGLPPPVVTTPVVGEIYFTERRRLAELAMRAALRHQHEMRVETLAQFFCRKRAELPDCREVDLYWGLHFALAMAHQTIRDGERLTKLSEGSCDLGDVDAIIERVVAVSAMALTGRQTETRIPAAIAQRGR